MYSMLKQRRNRRFHVISTRNARGVFEGTLILIWVQILTAQALQIYSKTYSLILQSCNEFRKVI